MGNDADVLKPTADNPLAGRTLTCIDDDQRAELCRVAYRWHAKNDPERLEALHRAITDAFYAWRDAQADAEGNIVIEPRVGLFPVARQTVPVRDLEPNQCAGPYIRDDIGLAFKLGAEGFGPFLQVVSTYDVAEVFSLITLYSWKDADPASLIRMNAFLVGQLLFDLDVSHEVGREMFDRLQARRTEQVKRAAGARDGRATVAANRRKDGTDTRSRCRKAAIEHFMRHADHGYPAMRMAVGKLLHKATSTVAKYTRGTREEALALIAQRVAERSR